MDRTSNAIGRDAVYHRHTLELERLLRTAIHAVNHQDWEFTNSAEAREFREHIAPEYTAQFDHILLGLGWDEHVAAARKSLEGHPDAHYEIHNITSEFSPDFQYAWTKIEIREVTSVVVSVFSQCFWRRAKDKWLWYRHVTLRGMGMG